MRSNSKQTIKTHTHARKISYNQYMGPNKQGKFQILKRKKQQLLKNNKFWPANLLILLVIILYK